MPALVTCAFQIAFACGDNKKGTVPAAGQAPKNDQTVFVSVLMTNSGIVRDSFVLDGPTNLRQVATRMVRQRKYSKKELDNWSTSTPSRLRHVTLAVTFPGKEGGFPKIRPGYPSGLSSCAVPSGTMHLPQPPSFLTSSPPVVLPLLANDQD